MRVIGYLLGDVEKPRSFTEIAGIAEILDMVAIKENKDWPVSGIGRLLMVSNFACAGQFPWGQMS